MHNYFLYLALVSAIAGLTGLTQLQFKRRYLVWGGLAITTVVLVLVLWTITDPPNQFIYGDFTKAYYVAGREILRDPARIYRGQVGFVNLPILALLFVKFALLKPMVSAVLFAVMGVVISLATGYFVIQYFGGLEWQRLILLALFLINGPLYYSIRVGNTTQFILPLLFGAAICLKGKRNSLAGILLAVAALFKLPLLLLVGYFVFRKKWQVVSAFMTTLGVTIVTSIVFFGWNLNLTWYQQCIRPFIGKPIGAYNVQSVDGFLVRLMHGATYLYDSHPIAVDLQYKLLRYVILSLVVGSVIWVYWRVGQPRTAEAQLLEVCTALCLALVISPISWTHYYSLMLVPLCLYIGKQLAIPQVKTWYIPIVASTLLMSLPVTASLPSTPILKVVMERVGMSHYFLGGVLLLATLLVARWQSAKKGVVAEI